MCRCSEFNQFSLLWAAHLFFSSCYFRVQLLNFDNCYRHKISTTKPHYLKVIDYVMTISITISTQKLLKEKLRTWAIYNLFKINQNKSLTFHCRQPQIFIDKIIFRKFSFWFVQFKDVCHCTCLNDKLLYIFRHKTRHDLSIEFNLVLYNPWCSQSHKKKTYNNCKKRDMRESIQYEEKKKSIRFLSVCTLLWQWAMVSETICCWSLSHSLEYITLGDQY